MIWRTWLPPFLATLVWLGIVLEGDRRTIGADDLKSLDGEWIFVEDLTEGKALERLGPPMSSKFSLGVVEGAIVLNGHGSGHKDVRVELDGTTTEIKDPQSIARYRGS